VAEKQKSRGRKTKNVGEKNKKHGGEKQKQYLVPTLCGGRSASFDVVTLDGYRLKALASLVGSFLDVEMWIEESSDESE
jgi:hypothetical protein